MVRFAYVVDLHLGTDVVKHLICDDCRTESDAKSNEWISIYLGSNLWGRCLWCGVHKSCALTPDFPDR